MDGRDSLRLGTLEGDLCVLSTWHLFLESWDPFKINVSQSYSAVGPCSGRCSSVVFEGLLLETFLKFNAYSS